MTPPVLLIAGPTASGKSALALRAAAAWGAEIVNADAIQIYSDLRVLSARPSAQEEARAPHHLFGIADASESWSVGRWLRAVQLILRDIASRDRPAVVVGGTGLYFKALTEGLAEIPEIPAPVREAAAEQLDRVGEAAFRSSLQALDPEAEARISAGDRQRLLRAFAVAVHTGRSLTAWQAGTTPPIASDAWRGVVLEPPRDILYARCDARLEAMAREGALEEVRRLLARDLDPTLPAMKAVGLRELASHLTGERSLGEAVALAQQETRRYAKRQLTWMRNQTPDWMRVGGADCETQWTDLKAAASIPAEKSAPQT